MVWVERIAHVAAAGAHRMKRVFFGLPIASTGSTTEPLHGLFVDIPG